MTVKHELPRCLVCGDEMAAETAVSCARCLTPCHKDCFRYSGVCAVFGCGCAMFIAYHPGTTAGIVRMVARLADPEIARPRRAQPLPMPARLAGQVLSDVDSGLELAARLAMGLGALALGALAVTARSPLFCDSTDCLAWLAALMLFAVGLAGWLGLDELYVIDANDGWLKWQRELFGVDFQTPLARMREFQSVGVATRDVHRLSALLIPHRYRAAWLVLHRAGGGMVRISGPMGSPGHDATRDVMRQAARITEAANLPLAAETTAEVTWALEPALMSAARRFFWLALAALVAAAYWFVPAWVTLPGAASQLLIGLALAMWSYYWLVFRPLGLDDTPRGFRAGDVRTAVLAALVAVACLTLVNRTSGRLAQSVRAGRWFLPSAAQLISPHRVVYDLFGYQLDLHFRWKVQGEAHNGRDYDVAGLGFDSRAAAERALQDLVTSESITCWYDPDNPAYAVLDRRFDVRLAWRLVPLLALFHCSVAWLVGRLELYWGRLGSGERGSDEVGIFPDNG